MTGHADTQLHKSPYSQWCTLTQPDMDTDTVCLTHKRKQTDKQTRDKDANTQPLRTDYRPETMLFDTRTLAQNDVI